VTAIDGADDGLVPIALAAATVKVYVVPFVRPVTVVEVALGSAVAVSPPGSEVAVYPVIGLPPSSDGAVQYTVASPFPATAVTFVGASGIVAGVMALERSEDGPVPAGFVAVTVKV